MERITNKTVVEHVDETVAVMGWIHRRRDHGKENKKAAEKND